MSEVIKEELRNILRNTSYYTRIFDQPISQLNFKYCLESNTKHIYNIYSTRYEIIRNKLTLGNALFFGFEELLKNMKESKEDKIIMYVIEKSDGFYMIFCESITKKLLGVIERKDK
jgi:hypothetical protein